MPFRPVVYESKERRSRQSWTYYCCICGILLCRPEVAFLELTPEQYRALRPYYCSLLAAGSWQELISSAPVTEHAITELTAGPARDDDLDEFLAAIPSYQVQDSFVEVVCCSRHNVLTQAVVAFHNFVREQLQPGLLVHGRVLSSLQYKDRPFISPIMLYAELRRPHYVRGMGTRPVLSTPELSNKVVVYNSQQFSDYAGTRGIILRRPDDDGEENEGLERGVAIPGPNRRRVVQEWWDFLFHNNPLFSNYLHQHMEQPPTMAEIILEQGELIEEAFVPSHDVNMSDEEFVYLVPAGAPGPYEVGPWTDVGEQVAGVDVLANEVAFKNPKLMALMFPWLFPFGEGHFQLRMAKKTLRDADGGQAEWVAGSYSKGICKTCLEKLR
ncbi:hypothetical protein BKA57DRAFT_479317 [Linnemannia elongata]|nr:hypothetical protein BKA57DRAFT_479317 [Linnemannia elongata]